MVLPLKMPLYTLELFSNQISNLKKYVTYLNLNIIINFINKGSNVFTYSFYEAIKLEFLQPRKHCNFAFGCKIFI